MVTVRLVVPTLGALFVASPEKDAVIVTLPPVAPVMVAVQVPLDDSVHEPVSETLPVPDSDRVIVSAPKEPG